VKNTEMSNPFLSGLFERYPAISHLEEKISEAADAMIRCYGQGGKVLVCGNGGSCASSDHIVGELMKSFEMKRPVDQKIKDNLYEVAGERGIYIGERLEKGLPAISLNAHSALISAIANDTDASLVFAQQVASYGNHGDIVMGISTSGNASNVVDALITAKAKGLITLGITGATGGKMKQYCDVLINLPEARTALVQELELPVYHTLCIIVENHFFNHRKI
jgi:D-sedoheptulose 7-phosphate isomerase